VDKAGFRFLMSVGFAWLALSGAPAGAAKTDPVFTVANYPVEASDKNAVAAKDKALADGQQAALRSLLKRIVPVTSYKQLSRLTKVKAQDFISGVSVRSERNSSTDYIANLDFSFQPEAVRALLQRENIAFVEAQAPPVIIVPVLRQGNPAEAKGDTGRWRDSWKGLDLDHALTPVKLEDLKTTIHNDTVNMLTGGDDSANRILSGEYKSDRVVLAVAEPDLANKKMLVILAGQDAVGPFVLKRNYRIADGDFNYTTELAAVVALGVLEGRWKALRAAAAPQAGETVNPDFQNSGTPAWSARAGASHGEPVRFTAEFSGLTQWNQIRTQLLDTPGVENLEIATVSARNADVTLNYPGGAQGLANAVGGRGLSLHNDGGGWTLKSGY
jgi:hypothetical protein